MTIAVAGEALIAEMRVGSVLTRSGDRYKPKSIRGYEQALRDHVLPDLGGMKLAALQRNGVQHLVDRLVATGAKPSTSAQRPLASASDLAARQDARRAAHHPDAGPRAAGSARRSRPCGNVARGCGAARGSTCARSARVGDRSVWRTPHRRAQALHVEDVDRSAGLLFVRRGWDQYEGEQRPKSRAGERRVPITDALRPHLARALASRQEGFLFGRTAELPFAPGALKKRAERHREPLELRTITFHQCRHTFASLMIAAGVNAKALQSIVGLPR